MRRPLVIGITGKSGSGKSTFCRALEDMGYTIIDCDRVAREAQGIGTACLQEIVAEFSPDILLPNGSLNRRRLGEICFSDGERLSRLNEICHPHIIAVLEAEIALCERVCIIEAGALYESGFDGRCDKIVGVVANETVSAARISLRDRIPLPQARERLAAQYPTELLLERADCIVFNDGSLERLAEKARILDETIKIWIDEVN